MALHFGLPLETGNVLTNAITSGSDLFSNALYMLLFLLDLEEYSCHERALTIRYREKPVSGHTIVRRETAVREVIPEPDGQ